MPQDLERGLLHDGPRRRRSLLVLRIAVAIGSCALVVLLVARAAPFILRVGPGHEAVPPPLSLVWLTDVHLQPFYNASLGPSCMCTHYGTYACDAPRAHDLPFPYNLSACAAEAAAAGPVRLWGRQGCDAPQSLLDAVLADASSNVPRPEVVLVTGDYLAHAWCQIPVEDVVAEAARAVHTVSVALAAAFGGSEGGAVIVSHPPLHSPVFAAGVVGNNDVVPDYWLPHVTDGVLGPQNPQLVAMADALSPALPSAGRHNFVRGGGVAFSVAPALDVLALNTIVYSPAVAPALETVPADPFGQLSWLDAELTRLKAEGRAAIISGHVPPTVDNHFFRLQWREQYAAEYARIVARHADAIRAQLFGHTHHNLLRAFPEPATLTHPQAASWPLGSDAKKETSAGVPGGDDAAAWPDDGPILLVAAAVSPVYGNSPSWLNMSLDRATGALTDWSVHAGDISVPEGGRVQPRPMWSLLLTASERYAPYDVRTSRGLRDMAAAMLTDDELFARYVSDTESRLPPGLSVGTEFDDAALDAADAAADGGNATALFDVEFGGQPRRPARVAVAVPLIRVKHSCAISHGWSQASFDACVRALQ